MTKKPSFSIQMDHPEQDEFLGALADAIWWFKGYRAATDEYAGIPEISVLTELRIRLLKATKEKE